VQQLKKIFTQLAVLVVVVVLVLIVVVFVVVVRVGVEAGVVVDLVEVVVWPFFVVPVPNAEQKQKVKTFLILTLQARFPSKL